MFNWRDQDNIFLANIGVAGFLFMLQRRWYQQLKKCHKSIEKIENDKVYEYDEYQALKRQQILKAQNSKDGRKNGQNIRSQRDLQFYLVKVKSEEFLEPVTLHKKIYSNQVNFVEPIISFFIEQKLNFEYDTFWVRSGITNLYRFYVNGVPLKPNSQKEGFLSEDVFEAELKYISRKDFGNMSGKKLNDFLKNIEDENIRNKIQNLRQQNELLKLGKLQLLWEGISFILESFMRFLSPKIHRQNDVLGDRLDRKPRFMGIFNGVLEITLKSIKNAYVILKINIQGQGLHKIELIGRNKSSFMNHYYNLGVNYILGIFWISVLSSLNLAFMCNYLKKKVPVIHKKYFKRNNETYLNPKGVDDDKLCQICYVNCRNLLFYKCRHLIMCYECFQGYKEEKCIICKIPLEGTQLINDCGGKQAWS